MFAYRWVTITALHQLTTLHSSSTLPIHLLSLPYTRPPPCPTRMDGHSSQIHTGTSGLRILRQHQHRQQCHVGNNEPPGRIKMTMKCVFITKNLLQAIVRIDDLVLKWNHTCYKSHDQTSWIWRVKTTNVVEE